MRIVTVLGTRPEIIRLSRIIEKLDRHGDHVLVHTGQNFDRRLSQVFFDELGIRQPNHNLGVRADTPGEQIGQILQRVEAIFAAEQPDRLLILGDTNSALSAIIAKRMQIAVFHMEAGNRCYDDRVPEEVNRRIVDHCSDLLLPYTARSADNLVREGVAAERILVTGNPILEVIEHYRPSIAGSEVLSALGIERGSYFLVTLHRAENVDVESRMSAFAQAFDRLAADYRKPVIVSTHPRTASRMREFGIDAHRGNVRFPEPFGFFDFITLEENACCVLSDSGTVQEECAILQVPCVTLRDVTERPETIECGSNILAGANPDRIMACVRLSLEPKARWAPPPEYLVTNVSDIVLGIVTGFRQLPFLHSAA